MKKTLIMSIPMYVLLCAIVIYPVMFHPMTVSVGDGGDGPQFMWYMGWSWHAILHGLNPLYTTSFNYPNGMNLMWNTSILAESLVFGFISYIANVNLAFNMLWVVNFVAVCIIGLLIMTELGAPKPLAIMGGSLFGVIPYTTAQSLGHANLDTTFIIVFIVYWIILMYKQKINNQYIGGIVLGIAVSMQFYTSTEVLVTFVMTMTVFLGVAVMAFGNDLSLHLSKISLRLVLTAALTCVVLCLPGIYEMYFSTMGGSSSISISPGSGDIYASDLLGFVIPTPLYALSVHSASNVTHNFTENYAEQNGYIGVVALTLITAAIITCWRNKLVRSLFFTLIIVAVLSMGSHLHINGKVFHMVALPWYIMEYMPVIKDALPSRIMLYGDIITIMLVVYLSDRIMKSSIKSDFTRIGIASSLMLATLVTWLPSIPMTTTRSVQSDITISSSRVIRGILSHNTVAVLLSDPTKVPQLMQIMADSGYSFSVTDGYGHLTTSPEGQDINSFNQYIINNSSISTKEVRAYIDKLGTNYLMYIPATSMNQPMSTGLDTTISSILGRPVYNEHHIIIWKL